jgi:hypothetical protein|tara:strand:+ start:508 stop:654 length:147 start_codon:yes stop_codon:yes gene_type:complete
VKLSAFSATGWFIAGSAVTLLLCTTMVVFIAGFSSGAATCEQAKSGQL